MPPTAGATIRSIGPSSAWRTRPASPLQTFSVNSGYMKTRAFWMKTGLLRPELRMKWPSRMAPACLNTSMTSASVMPLSLAPPLDAAHHRTGAQLGDQPVEVFHVGDFHVDQDHREVRRRFEDPDVGDVALIVGDHLGDLNQRPRLVDRRHLDARRKASLLVLVDIPSDVEPALGLVVERLQRRRLDRINGDSFAR